MATLRLTKFFQFSASHENNGRIIGHNYTLSVTMDWLSEEDEAAVVKNIEQDLMAKIRSRDLSLHVDFLKGVQVNEANLLREFEAILKKSVTPVKIYQLTLRRDDRTLVAMEIVKP